MKLAVVDWSAFCLVAVLIIIHRTRDIDVVV